MLCFVDTCQQLARLLLWGEEGAVGLGPRNQLGTWEACVPSSGLCCFLPSRLVQKGPRGPSPAERIRHALWATDFPWVRDHSPGNKSVLNKQPICTSPPPPIPPLGCSPHLLVHLAAPRCSPPDFRITGALGAPDGAAKGSDAQEPWACQVGTAHKSSGGVSDIGHQDVGATPQHPCSDTRTTFLNLSGPAFPLSGTWGLSGETKAWGLERPRERDRNLVPLLPLPPALPHLSQAWERTGLDTCRPLSPDPCPAPWGSHGPGGPRAQIFCPVCPEQAWCGAPVDKDSV